MDDRAESEYAYGAAPTDPMRWLRSLNARTTEDLWRIVTVSSQPARANAVDVARENSHSWGDIAIALAMGRDRDRRSAPRWRMR